MCFICIVKIDELCRVIYERKVVLGMIIKFCL